MASENASPEDGGKRANQEDWSEDNQGSASVYQGKCGHRSALDHGCMLEALDHVDSGRLR